MDERLEYICDFRTSKELEIFFLTKQKNVSFSLSKPREFDGEFLPLFCFSYFFPPKTKFRLVRRENTIRDAEIKLVSTQILPVQITQATNTEQMRNHNHHEHSDVFVALLDKQGKQDVGIVSCVHDEAGFAAQLVLKALDLKVERYKKMPDYESSETTLLIYLSAPSLKMCFAPGELLAFLLKKVPQENLDFFKGVQVLYFQEKGHCSLVNLTNHKEETLSISPDYSFDF